MRDALPLEGLLVRKRLTVSASLIGLVVLAWVYLALTMPATPAGVLPGWLDRVIEVCRVDAGGPWTIADAAWLLVMWLVMSVAMMLPTAAPMILTFADISATKLSGRALLGRVGVFAGGYLAVWGAYAVAATGLQWALRAGAVEGMEPAAQPWLAGGLLVVAGLYQFTPLKDLCLSQCRNPMTWFMGNWRNGAAGAWRMGLAHGAWCLGCCWALMLVMIAAGAMNLAWMAVLAALMLAEKVLPHPQWTGRAAGILLTGWGLALLLVGV